VYAVGTSGTSRVDALSNSADIWFLRISVRKERMGEKMRREREYLFGYHINQVLITLPLAKQSCWFHMKHNL
jgi:hypothetical protein